MTHRILVTGGAGFMQVVEIITHPSGSHFIKYWLHHHPDAFIVNLDKLDYCSSLKLPLDLDQDNLLDLSGSSCRYCFIKCDITQSQRVQDIIQHYCITMIVHFAAQSHVDHSFGVDSLSFTQTNVFGTHVLLEAARMGGIQKFIHISTDEVYGQVVGNEPSKLESCPLKPSNPYAATKAAAEQLVMAYQTSFQLPTIITRSNNVYGPGQYPEKVIPKFICSLLQDKPCLIHGDGTHSRHYLYISDMISALECIILYGDTGAIYNIGSDIEISNRELAKYLMKEMGKEACLEYGPDRPYNDQRYAICSSKLHALGWSQKIEFKKGIQDTIAWYKTHADTYWN